MSKAISIIIAVYNVAPYILNCLKSIAEQSFSNYKLILVDDCGTDDSIGIAEHFLSRSIIDYSILHNKENIGVSASRNLGLSAANSEFVLFIDPDDWIEPGMLNALYTAAVNQGADIVAFNGVEYYQQKEYYEPMPSLNGIYEPGEYLTLLFQGSTTAHMWLRMTRKELYQGLSFPPGVIFEDFLIVPLLIGKANKIVHLGDVFYTYVQRSNQSNLTTKRPPNIATFMMHLSSMEKKVQEAGYGNEKMLKKYQFMLLSFILSRLFHFNGSYRNIRSEVNIIRKYIGVSDLFSLKDMMDKKAWLILLSAKIDGRLSRKLLHSYSSAQKLS